MRVRAFHVGDGDCLLVSSGDGVGERNHIMVDGGRKGSFRAQARPEIYQIDSLDVVYVSHIDDDHISGVVALLEDVVEWRVHDRRTQNGEVVAEPDFPRPPAIREVWHNALFELVGSDLEPHVPGVLSAMAGIMTGSSDPRDRELAMNLDNLATGERSAMELSRRISADQLDIDTNRPRGELMKVGNARYRRVGDFTIDELGPTQEAIDDLRTVWQRWLRDNRDAVRELQAKMLADENRLGAATGITASAPELVASLGDGTITEPNLASLMLLVRDRTTGGQILLTGDGSSDDVLTGLAHHRKLDAQGAIHVDVLKVQHHGATANVTADFVRRVTADHYIFCGNGAHHNPEREVVEAMAKARLGADGEPPVGPPMPFTFHFTSRHDSPDLSDSRAEHMTMIEGLVGDIARDHDPAGRFATEFIRDGGLTVDC